MVLLRVISFVISAIFVIGVARYFWLEFPVYVVVLVPFLIGCVVAAEFVRD